MDGVTHCRECGRPLPREQFEGRDHVLKFPPMLRDERGRVSVIFWRRCEACTKEAQTEKAPRERPAVARSRRLT
jgi:hypothetical protein